MTGEPHSIVLTDTVGFIHELLASLMDAFRATLDKVTEADALLHVVDLLHPAWLSPDSFGNEHLIRNASNSWSSASCFK